ncbi:MAG TPA: GntP family permease, partial [Flavisolibacter sp.]|nr:GntP family permease [Flavisolibacter sp.]
MAASFLQIIGWLIVSVLVIIVLTSKFRLHPFFVLLMACFIVGLGIQLPPAEILSTIKDGFGNILKSLGLIVVLGTTLGVILEHTGSTEAMALYILKKTG